VEIEEVTVMNEDVAGRIAGGARIRVAVALLACFLIGYMLMTAAHSANVAISTTLGVAGLMLAVVAGGSATCTA
jgi:hypothetical protein